MIILICLNQLTRDSEKYALSRKKMFLLFFRSADCAEQSILREILLQLKLFYHEMKIRLLFVISQADYALDPLNFQMFFRQFSKQYLCDRDKESSVKSIYMSLGDTGRV